MKEDKNIDLEFSNAIDGNPATRREFLKRIGGGIIVFFAIGDVSVLEAQGRQSGYPTDFNAYLRIGEDGRVTCLTGKVELGQGNTTALGQMLADELDVTFELVDMIMGDTDICPYDAGTYGSRSIKYFGPPLRAAGAEARAVLIELAAEHLKVPKDRLTAKEGIILIEQKMKTGFPMHNWLKGK